MPPAKKPPGKKPEEKDDPEKKPPEKKPPEKKYVPGWNPVSDDEKDKGAKKSRRRKKGGNKDEPSEAGPSSAVASPSSAQTGSKPGPSVPKASTSTGTMQTPASTSARQSMQAPNQPAIALPYSTRPVQNSTSAIPRQAGHSSSQAGQVAVPGPASGPSLNQGLPAPSNPNEAASAGKVSSSTGPSKEYKSSFGDGKQEVVRLKGQPPRPESNQRNSIHLASNYFQLTHKADLKLWHYQITVHPEIKGPKLTQLIKIALNESLQGGKPGLVTDFSAIMLSVRDIPQQVRKFKLKYMSEVETQASEDAKEYVMSLDLIGTVDLSNLENYLRQLEINPSGLPVEQALDIILGHHRKLSDDIAIVNKRKAFSVAANAEIQELAGGEKPVLVARRGYFSSVRMLQSKFWVNINVSHGAFYGTDKTLNEIIEWLVYSQRVVQSKVPGLLRGLRVQSSHIPRVWSFWGYPRRGEGKGFILHPTRINGPDDATYYTPGQVRFFHEKVKGQLNEKDKENAKKGKLISHDYPCSCSGSWISVAEYFSSIRREPISDDNLKLPVVNVGSNKRPTYLPSHLLKVIKGQISKLKLNPEHTRAMIKFAVRDPVRNAQSIKNSGFNTLGFMEGNQELGCFGVRVEQSMTTLYGRILPRPQLLYQDELFVHGNSWNLSPVSFRKPVQLTTNWACLRIVQNSSRDWSIHAEPCRGRLKNFQSHLRRIGITVLDNDYHGDLEIKDSKDYSRLDEWFRDCQRYRVTFLIVLLPDIVSSQLYNHIKKYGDIKHGIHTVCVKYNKLGDSRYDDNVALKINLKLGGTNHQLQDDAYGCMLGSKTMVVGIDVTHPPPGSEGAPSVAAVVASCDEYLSQWPADLRINQSGQEMVEMLQEMLTTRLEHYKKVNDQRLPKNLLIYRDGVGEGQYKIVINEELPRLRDACRRVYGKEYLEGVYPQISLIVVGKRHHTRFYRLDNKGNFLAGSLGNPVPGTVVDNKVTRHDSWDFYLQSHAAITGTARPAHYFVLLDEIFEKTKKDPVAELERLTYNLCHLYGKATVSVSIPPPVYYADLACGRGKRYLSRVFDQDQDMNAAVGDADVRVHDALKDTMFYI